MATSLQDLMAKFEKQEESARQSNLSRYSEILGIYDKIIARSAPGGAFEQAGLSDIETARRKSVGQGTQSLISSGLSGTTTAAQLGTTFEKEVGTPARLKLEDIMEQRRSQAQIGKAGAIERREDVGPDPNLAFQAAQASSSSGNRRPSLIDRQRDFIRGGLGGMGSRAGSRF